MFDNVGDVGPRTIDAGLGEAAVEQLSRRSDKRVTGKVVRTTRKQCNGAPPCAGRQSSVQGEVARVHLGDANLAAAWSYSLKRHIVPVAANAVLSTGRSRQSADLAHIPDRDPNADQEPASGNARAPCGVPERVDDDRRRGTDLPDDELPVPRHPACRQLVGLAELGNIYARIMHPTNAVLEERVAALEGGAAGLALASGRPLCCMRSRTSAQAGDNFVSSTDLYGGTWNCFSTR